MLGASRMNYDYDNFIYKNLEFTLTCHACPEQYDVFDLDSDRKQVGYVRLRWGAVQCTYPDVGGDPIYRHSFSESEDNTYKGCFDSDEERTVYLTEIAEAILERIHG